MKNKLLLSALLGISLTAYANDVTSNNSKISNNSLEVNQVSSDNIAGGIKNGVGRLDDIVDRFAFLAPESSLFPPKTRAILLLARGVAGFLSNEPDITLNDIFDRINQVDKRIIHLNNNLLEFIEVTRRDNVRQRLETLNTQTKDINSDWLRLYGMTGGGADNEAVVSWVDHGRRIIFRNAQQARVKELANIFRAQRMNDIYSNTRDMTNTNRNTMWSNLMIDMGQVFNAQRAILMDPSARSSNDNVIFILGKYNEMLTSAYNKVLRSSIQAYIILRSALDVNNMDQLDTRNIHLGFPYRTNNYDSQVKELDDWFNNCFDNIQKSYNKNFINFDVKSLRDDRNNLRPLTFGDDFNRILRANTFISHRHTPIKRSDNYLVYFNPKNNLAISYQNLYENPIQFRANNIMESINFMPLKMFDSFFSSAVRFHGRGASLRVSCTNSSVINPSRDSQHSQDLQFRLFFFYGDQQQQYDKNDIFSLILNNHKTYASSIGWNLTFRRDKFLTNNQVTENIRAAFAESNNVPLSDVTIRNTSFKNDCGPIFINTEDRGYVNSTVTQIRDIKAFQRGDLPLDNLDSEEE